MAPQPALQRPVFGFFLCVSALAFALGFWISFQQDSQRIEETGHLALLHLLYAEELKDDMAVIDWSKRLEKLDDVLAFQAFADSKVVAEGGNHNFLPRSIPSGVIYHLPFQWIYHSSTSSGTSAKQLTIVFNLVPGPLLWGLTLGGLCLLSGLGTGWLASSRQTGKTASSAPVAARTQEKPITPQHRSVDLPRIDSKKPYLFLDRNYIIQQITPEAASCFQKSPEELLQGHLFDLSPDPRLMNAIEKSEEVRLTSPFPSHPRLSVSLKTDSDGTLLFLETV